MAEFQKHLPQCYANYVGDDTISPDLRTKFDAFLRGIDLSGLRPDEARDRLWYEIDDYCHGYLQEGEDISLMDGEMIGCARELAATAQYIAGKLPSLTKEDASLALRESLALPDLRSQLAHLQNLLQGLPLSPFQAFSYRAEARGTHPASALEPDHATCKLGLRNYGQKHLIFALGLPRRQKTFRPTFFDAGPNDLWRPGGRTLPLKKCSTACVIGMEEVVHDRIQLSWVVDLVRGTLR